MHEIEQLKDAEKQMWEDGDSAETVHYLKVTEEDVAPAHPRPRRTRAVSANPQRGAKLVKLVAFGAVAWLGYTLMMSGLLWGNWWALFLLFPILKNVQAIGEDRSSGTVDRQTKRYLNGAVYGTLFTGMMLTGAWNLMLPGLFVAWGVSQVLFSRWRSEPAIL